MLAMLLHLFESNVCHLEKRVASCCEPQPSGAINISKLLPLSHFSKESIHPRSDDLALGSGQLLRRLIVHLAPLTPGTERWRQRQGCACNVSRENRSLQPEQRSWIRDFPFCVTERAWKWRALQDLRSAFLDGRFCFQFAGPMTMSRGITIPPRRLWIKIFCSNFIIEHRNWNIFVPSRMFYSLFIAA